MANNAEIAVVLKLVADQFARELRKQQGFLGEFVGSINRSKIMIGAVGGAFLALAKSTANYGEELLKTKQVTGMSVEDLSRLRFAANRADMDFDSLSGSLAKYAKILGEARTGSGDAAQVYSILGVSLTDATSKARPMLDVLLDLGDALNQYADGDAKSLLASKVFGKEYAGMLRTLAGGRQAFTDAARDAKAFGLVMSEEDAKKANEFNDRLKDLSGSLTGLKNEVLLPLLSPLTTVAKLFTDLTKEVKDATKHVVSFGVEAVKSMDGAGDAAARNFNKSKIGKDVTARVKATGITNMPGLGELWDNFKQTSFAENMMARFNATGLPWLLGRGKKTWDATDPNKPNDATTGASKAVEDKPDAPNLQTGEEAKVVEKLSKALLDQAKVRAELAKATLDHKRAIQEERRSIEDNVLALQSASGQSEEDTLKKELEVKHRRLAEDKAFHEQRLKLLDESTRRQIAIIQGSAQEQAAHLIRAGKMNEARQVIDESKLKVAQLREENLVNREAEKAELDRIPVKQSLIQTESSLKSQQLDRLHTVAQAEADLSRVEQQASLDRSALDIAHREGKLNDIELLNSQIRLERELREARIAAAQATLSRTTPGSADSIKAQAEVDRLLAENASKRALEDRQRVQETKEYEIRLSREAAQMELEIAELQYADEKVIADKKIKLLDEEMQQRLLTVKTGSEEEARIREYYAAKKQDVDEQANGGFFDGMRRGWQGYRRDMDGALGYGRQTVIQTAQAMQSGFQTFFFDFMDNKVTSLKDVFKGVLNFAKQIIAQITAQMATTGIMDWAMGKGAGMGSASGMWSMFSGFFGGMGFNHGGVVPAVQHFATGGVSMPAFTNGDSIRAMLTPGERILTKGQNAEVMDLIRRGASGAAGGGPITVITENHTGNNLPDARVEQSYDQMKGLVLRVIYEERGRQSPLGTALRQGAR